MGLRSEISDWRQPDGLIVPRQEKPGTENPDTTGDGIKHFCIYHALLVKRGESTPADLVEFEAVIRACFVREGLPNRSPTKPGEQITKDALIAIGYAARLLKSDMGYRVLNLGNSCRFLWLKWFYPNMFPRVFDPGVRIPLSMALNHWFWEAWMGKNPEVVCHLQYAGLPAAHVPHVFRRLWFWGFLVVSSVTAGSIYSIANMMCETAAGHDSFGDFFIHWWHDRLARAGGMQKRLLDEYDEGHPIVRYWR